MKGAEKRMDAATQIFGRIVKKYQLPLDKIEDLNLKYEEVRKNLKTFNHRLAGRLQSELDFTEILQSTSILKDIVKCMQDYVDDLKKFGLLTTYNNLNILSCWINDMKQGEYNPPHTHHDLTGWSTVLFLKVPEFVRDTEYENKFRDGLLGFITEDGLRIEWTEPKVGDFYIFEACHQHCVMPFKTKINGEVRRSMSFNFT